MKIIVKDEIGREVNLYNQFLNNSFPYKEVNPKWKHFEQSVTTYPAPGLKDGEQVAELQWQHKWKDFDWENCKESDLDYFSEFGDSFRQIYRISPSLKEAEVKQDAYKTITEHEVHNWCSTGMSEYTLSRLTDILNGDYSLANAREDVLSFRPKD